MAPVDNNKFRIQRYVYLLVTLIIFISALLLGNQLYFSSKLQKLSSRANNYHLKSSSLASEAMVNLLTIETLIHSLQTETENTKNELSEQNLTSYQQLLREKMQNLFALDQQATPGINPVLVERLQSQWLIFDRSMTNLNSLNKQVIQDFDKNKDALQLSIYQLQRQHNAAHDELLLKIQATQNTSTQALLIILGLILIPGSPIGWRLIQLIHKSVALRLQAEQQLKQHQESLENTISQRTNELNLAQHIAQIGNWNWSVQDDTVSWSDELFIIFGLEVNSRTPDLTYLKETIFPDDLDIFNSTLEQTRLHGHAHADYRLIQQSGTQIWVSSNMFAQYDEHHRLLRIDATVQNISKRKQTEQNLISAKEEAEAANRTKDVFLSRMSHELRTPLNAILGFAQLLEAYEESPLSTDQLEHVGEIINAGDHLLVLINELLDLERIQTGAFAISQEPIALNPLIQNCISLIIPNAKQRNIRIRKSLQECSHSVLADNTRLTQVVLNLLSNAIKYNREDGTVYIECNADDKYIEICIKDEGEGLTAEEQSRLFVPFERLDADSHAIPGTGIGLALSKKLVELMDGEIGIRSTRGEGSTFWIRLPITTLPAMEMPHSMIKNNHGNAESSNTETITVLCIEDNPANLRLLESMLSKMKNTQVLSSMSPGLGLDMARTHNPHLILLDINLPEMDGFAVLECLRADQLTKHIPVIAISANAMPRDISMGLAAGFSHYLTKPLNLNKLKRSMSELLSNFTDE